MDDSIWKDDLVYQIHKVKWQVVVRYHQIAIEIQQVALHKLEHGMDHHGMDGLQQQVFHTIPHQVVVNVDFDVMDDTHGMEVVVVQIHVVQQVLIVIVYQQCYMEEVQVQVKQ